MKLLIWIIAFTSLSASSYAANSINFSIRDFYRLEVTNEELPLKSIARILLSANMEKGDKYEKNVANRITKFKENIQ